MNAKIIKTKISEGLEQTMTKAYICLILNLNTKHKKNTHTKCAQCGFKRKYKMYSNKVWKHEYEGNKIRLWCKIICKIGVE